MTVLRNLKEAPPRQGFFSRARGGFRRVWHLPEDFQAGAPRRSWRGTRRARCSIAITSPAAARTGRRLWRC